MLQDRVALITGASRGLGAAIAIELASQGAHIAAIYQRDAQGAQNTVDACLALGVKAKAYAVDVADFDAAKQTVDQVMADFGALDILVNNAGITRDKLLLMMKEEDFDSVLSINLKGAFNMIRHISPIMLKRKQGRIINITSVIGLMGNIGQANYAAAKAGLIGLTKSTAKELASRGITCNAVAPGFFDTDMTKDMTEQARSAILGNIPLGRMGRVEEVAATVSFLAQDTAAYITGEVIRVDGGLAI